MDGGKGDAGDIVDLGQRADNVVPFGAASAG